MGAEEAKRYVAEAGSIVVDHLFGRVPRDSTIAFSVGLTEVVSILVRKHNANVIGTPRFQLALRSFRQEVNAASPVRIIPADRASNGGWSGDSMGITRLTGPSAR